MAGRDGTQAGVRDRLIDKVGRQRDLGYLVAILYLTPGELEASCAAGELDDVAVEGIAEGALRIMPGPMSDPVKLARGDPDHAYVWAQWGDAFGLERKRAAEAGRTAAAEAKVRLKEEATRASAERKALAAERKLAKAAKALDKAKAAKRKAKGGAKKKAKPRGAAKAGTGPETLH